MPHTDYVEPHAVPEQVALPSMKEGLPRFDNARILENFRQVIQCSITMKSQPRPG